jgi:hypothetical protein
MFTKLRRTALVVLALALAGVGVVAATPADAGPRPAAPKPTVVFVHGAFADSSTILMTGASRGIGLHAARAMLDERPDLRLIVVARGEQPELPRTTVVRGDLASLRTVRAIADGIDEPLDGFVGNAGAQLKTGSTSTVDGYETTFAVNVLAQHLLLSRLPFTEAARIVLTTSDSHFGRSRRTFGMVPPPRWSTPEHLARIGPRPAEPGAYIDRWNVTPSSPESYDERREEELWSEAERLTAAAIA